MREIWLRGRISSCCLAVEKRETGIDSIVPLRIVVGVADWRLVVNFNAYVNVCLWITIPAAAED